MTRAQFAARLAQFAVMTSAWSRDVLVPRIYQLNDPMPQEPVERFIRDMRERLDDLEREATPPPDIVPDND